MRIRTAVVPFVAFSLVSSSSLVAAQRPSTVQESQSRPDSVGGRHVVDPDAMRQAIINQAVTDRKNHDAVVAVLQRSEVRELADRLGLSVTRAEGALSTLTSTELAQLAESARAADAQLAGGANTVTLSVTTLLLIIIIVLLVAR